MPKKYIIIGGGEYTPPDRDIGREKYIEETKIIKDNISKLERFTKVKSEEEFKGYVEILAKVNPRISTMVDAIKLGMIKHFEIRVQTIESNEEFFISRVAKEASPVSSIFIIPEKIENGRYFFKLAIRCSTDEILGKSKDCELISDWMSIPLTSPDLLNKWNQTRGSTRTLILQWTNVKKCIEEFNKSLGDIIYSVTPENRLASEVNGAKGWWVIYNVEAKNDLRFFPEKLLTEFSSIIRGCQDGDIIVTVTTYEGMYVDALDKLKEQASKHIKAQSMVINESWVKLHEAITNGLQVFNISNDIDKIERELNNGQITPELRGAFTGNNIRLSDNAKIQKMGDIEWEIDNNYHMKKVENNLNIYIGHSSIKSISENVLGAVRNDESITIKSLYELISTKIQPIDYFFSKPIDEDCIKKCSYKIH